MHRKQITALFFITLTILFCSSNSHAQTPQYGLLFSQNTLGGTARSMGVGGAFGALGGDFSVIGINPAGIGIYQKSEIIVSPAFHTGGGNIDYIGTSSKDSRNQFHFSNAGAVFAEKINPGGQLVINFAAGVNRTKNFNRQTLLQGFNTTNSITDYYALRATGINEGDLYNVDPFGSYLAYNTGLINAVNNTNEYSGVASGGNVTQQEFATYTGGIDEYTLGLGANYENKVYFGLSLGIPVANFESELLFKETDSDNVIGEFEELTLQDNTKTVAAGLNAKLGVIYRLTNTIRLGGSVHLPTSLELQDRYSSTMTSTFANAPQYIESTPDGSYNYNLQTPWKFIGSGALIIPRIGFLSLDYELVNYRQMKFEFDDDPAYASDLNQEIDDLFKMTSNIRLGGEFAYKVMRARLGYALFGSPYKDGNSLLYHNITTGLGLRGKKVFMDVAYVYSTHKNLYRPYFDAPQSEIRNSDNNIVLTLGFKFD